jgi:hypothetical protein
MERAETGVARISGPVIPAVGDIAGSDQVMVMIKWSAMDHRIKARLLVIV